MAKKARVESPTNSPSEGAKEVKSPTEGPSAPDVLSKSPLEGEKGHSQGVSTVFSPMKAPYVQLPGEVCVFFNRGKCKFLTGSNGKLFEIRGKCRFPHKCWICGGLIMERINACTTRLPVNCRRVRFFTLTDQRQILNLSIDR